MTLRQRRSQYDREAPALIGRGLKKIGRRKNPLRATRRVEELLESTNLIHVDHAKYSSGVVLRSGSVEKLVGVAVVRGAATKLDPPELVNFDRFSGGSFHRPNEGAGRHVETIDGAGVGVIADQQRIAERAEVRRRDRESPTLGQAVFPRPAFSRMSRPR